MHVFFSYLELCLLLSDSLPVHVALLCGPQLKLAFYLVRVSIFIPFPPTTAICCPTNTHCYIAANSRSTFLLHKAQGLNSTFFLLQRQHLSMLFNSRCRSIQFNEHLLFQSFSIPLLHDLSIFLFHRSVALEFKRAGLALFGSRPLHVK